MKKKLESINLLKAIAALLITNSHLKEIYPQPLRFLAFGGAIGNGLFFVVSGFLIGNNLSRIWGGYKWFIDKLVRIYPAVWIVTPIYLAFRDNISHMSKVAIVTKFLYPTIFWFINVILIMYFIAMLIEKYGNARLWYVSIGVSVIGYLGCALLLVDFNKYNIESSYLKCLYYYIIFAFGVLIGSKRLFEYSDSNKLWIASASTTFIIHAIASTSTQKTGRWNYQFVTHICIILCCVSLLILLRNNEEIIKEFVVKIRLKAVIDLISMITLEIYLLNDAVVVLGKNIYFPLNLIMVISVLICAAYIVHYVALLLQKLLRKKNEIRI